MVLLAGVVPTGLAACGVTGGAPPPPPAATDEVGAAFPAGGLVDVIVVDATGNQPLRRATLIGPTGTATPAFSVEANPAEAVETGQLSTQNPFAAHIATASSGGAPPPLSVETGTTLRGRTRVLAIVSSASIRLPDPVAYRRDWRHYRIRLEFGDPPAVATEELAAPAPPTPAG
jgi:hypothetical protein